MGDPVAIEIPAREDTVLTIKTPRMIANRGKYDIRFPYGTPLQNAFASTGLFPLPENLAVRIADAMSNVRVVRGTADVYLFDRYTTEHQLKKNMEEMTKGAVPESYEDITEHLFKKIFTPADFTLEQKIKLFDYFAESVIRQIDQENLEHLDYEYRQSHRYLHSGDSGPWGRRKAVKEAYLFTGCWTLNQWKVWPTSERYAPMGPMHECANKAIKTWHETQTEMREMANYDWRPLDFIFGDQLPTLIQLKTATLKAGLKVTYDTFTSEYRNFLDRIEDTLRIGGAMRHNAMTLDTKLLGKYRVYICIYDKGKGVQLSEDISDVAEIGKELGKGLLSLPFRILGGL